MSLLEVKDLRKTYDRREVVKGVTFSVEKGEIVGLLGQNGAGKTTAFRMTIGMIRCNSGQVMFMGQDVSRLPMYQRARRGMGYLSQEPSIFQRMSVADNVDAVLETLRISRAERRKRLEQLLEQLSLVHLRNATAMTLSGGERRRLEITRALATEPRLILLDEPFSGVDPKVVNEIQEIVLKLRDTGIGVLLTDHNVHDTLSVTDRSYIISEGRIEASGTPEELLANPRARDLYFGERLQIEHIVRSRDHGKPDDANSAIMSEGVKGTGTIRAALRIYYSQKNTYVGATLPTASAPGTLQVVWGDLHGKYFAQGDYSISDLTASTYTIKAGPPSLTKSSQLTYIINETGAESGTYMTGQ
ncbi:MAG: LPS export ABC transporter ATP-binding protein [Candidatus Brocadiia bacterium]|jgi:lipopolysaccharide export system ATP-binding protein